jgi:hypothetical protein
MQETPLDLFTDGTNPPSGLPLFRILTLLREASRITGRDFNVKTDALKDQMKEAGFVDVEETKIRVPLGPWHTDPHQKEIGR